MLIFFTEAIEHWIAHYEHHCSMDPNVMRTYPFSNPRAWRKKIRKAKHYLIWKNNDAIYDSPMLFLWTLSF